MNHLPKNASFAGLKKYAVGYLKSAGEFGEAVRRFGREPADDWGELERLYGEKLAELAGIVGELKGKTSLPGADKAQAIERVNSLALRLDALVHDLRLSLTRACPQEPELNPPNEECARGWKEYDRRQVKIVDLPLERHNLQRLLRRAHDPGAVLTIALPKGGDFAWTSFHWDLYSALRELVYTTPLPRFEGLSLRAWKREHLPAVLDKNGAGSRLYERFHSGILSASAPLRSAARRELKRIVQASWEEEHGKGITEGFPLSRQLYEFWVRVKLELHNQTAASRRAALCALPELRLSVITKVFHDDCLRVILHALRDPDGMVRHKVYRFALDLALVWRIDHTAVTRELLGQLGELRADRTAPAVARQLAEKLIKDLAYWRGYDQRRGAEIEY